MLIKLLLRGSTTLQHVATQIPGSLVGLAFAREAAETWLRRGVDVNPAHGGA